MEASIRDTMGQTYMDLGLYPEARKQLERALDLHRRLLGAENPKTLKTMSRLGSTAELQGKYAEAEALLSQALEIQRRVLGPEHPDTLYSMNNLANVYYYQGKYPQAEALDSQTLEIRRRVLGPGASRHAVFHEQSGRRLRRTGQVRAGRGARQPDPGDRAPGARPGASQTRCSTMNNLAVAYYFQGKYAQAEALYSQTLEIRRRVLGPEHPNTLTVHGQSGQRLQLPGQVRAGRGALTARPWRSSAACWARSIPTR